MINATDFTNEADYNAALDEEAAAFFYTNPLQAAFAESRARTPIVNQTPEIASLLAEDKFVVVSETEHCCPVTDGTIGYSIRINSVHDTLEQARAVCPEDEEGSISRPNRQLGKKRLPLTTMRRFPSNDDPSSLSLPTEAAPSLPRDDA